MQRSKAIKESFRLNWHALLHHDHFSDFDSRRGEVARHDAGIQQLVISAVIDEDTQVMCAFPCHFRCVSQNKPRFWAPMGHQLIGTHWTYGFVAALHKISEFKKATLFITAQTFS